MLDYDVDPGILRPLVPAGVALDLLDGRALVTVVGFRFLRTRVLGVPIPLHRDFDEVNLRFYVRRELAGGEVRHGVTFVRELVPRLAIALVARALFNEPYRAVPMRSSTTGRLSYEWRSDGLWQSVSATPSGEPAEPPAGSQAAFVTRRHWGYTRQRDGRTIEYEVRHPVWRVWRAEAPRLSADVAGLWGEAFVAPLAGAPSGASIADGSAVTVSAPRWIR
ncbi:Protein of unknown function DUF2071 [Gemmatirosa kalamazoonensis]|uniref:DUF2071 domain-containing protein n=1 Tax=Gemmatirosa kalamazoonensis TaxID=861299 RepID=W0RBN7_9BACT|nr:Protein of unknown function DUF2071 [Gemmatirosa kalamazoonensis]